ncbi:flagellar biosynthesis protein FlhB [Paraburkholderia sp. SIMBA_055]|uniref:Flagellar biosynthetic protein FlhB n=1 Tax=Paraburkholderia graminis (strain ATCC 700544 / DSM 17151 / LMG 18924 / NCIMB 13744 / C4D1M) TaxID=396598 RepID=B1G4G1_PARG4|nr:flagellar biosynthesis protein FlhB [Paraburkholderia graminis]AXF09481.1 flagellar type III secretion system protein FlhB [Paraburkholderia graminis]EDT08976.1 flagellar biosynthetic protein FlhB [Paraburkholderia graminis C4D1M]MDR6469609.1 flagellar biosynthetic protein FlhB [Paraburkholderia graminis]MDR6478261.1 flagellar biosynthetic protein FlhB [Paraburkholderia graminis]CAB3711715.1 Flagellar biosynthetic protein FlhB [Paraburkholderia graminis C4D1M]
MAEESDLEKTESATPRRLQKAREEGQIARSRELSTFALLAAGFFGVWGMSDSIGEHLQAMLRAAFTFDHAGAFETHRMMIGAGAASREGLYALLPILAVTGAAALLAPMALGGWQLSTKGLEPKFERLNPIAGLGKIFSINGPIQLAMSLAKTLVVGIIGGTAIWNRREEILALATQPLHLALANTVHLIAVCCGMTVAGMFVVAALDVPYQLWQFHKKLRMSKEEVKREHRESEGDPHVKGRIRQQQRAIARRRMMTQVPKADVVVTNPTHFAVALQYTDGEMRAPKVVAKGVNLVAARIRELAAENNVPLLEAPPLARALYHNVELNREIPGQLYGAVAEVLAWVYQLRRFKTEGGDVPVAPTELEVPAELDKGGVSDEDADQEAADTLNPANEDGASA